MRVDDRASVAYAAASFRSRPRFKNFWCGRAAHRTLGFCYALCARHAGSRDLHTL